MTTPAAGPGAAAGVQGQAGAEGAPSGFDALLAEVGAKASADEALAGGPVVTEAETDPEPAGLSAADPMLAALAALLAQPAPAVPVEAAGPALDADADATVRPGAPAQAATAPLPADLFEQALSPPPAPGGDLAVGADALANVGAGPASASDVLRMAGEAAPDAALAAIDAVAVTPASASDPATAPAPATVKAAATVAPVAAPPVEAVAPAQVAPAQVAATPAAKPGETPAPSTRTERPARAEAAPAGENAARAADQAVETETAEAVVALAAASGQGGETAQDAGGQPPQTAPDTAAPASAAPPAARAAETSAPPVEAHAVRGSPETVAKLSADILKKLDGRSTRFDVALDPLGLGQVNVKVEIGADGAITAAMSFETAGAAAELRGRAGELRSALQQAGFNLADNALSFDVANQGGGRNGGQAGWQFQEGGHNGGGAAAGRAFEAALSGAEALVSDLPFLRAPSRDGVDIRI